MNASGNPVTVEDFAGFSARWLRPLAGGFRQYTVLSAPPPLGGTQVIQPLVMLNRFPLKETGLPAQSPQAAAWIIDAVRMANRDHSRWVHDPDTPVPAAGLCSPSYAGDRAALIGVETIPESMPAGTPWDFDSRTDARFAALNPWHPMERPRTDAGDDAEESDDPEPADDPDEDATTHLSVVDAQGNAVALTMTLGPGFGSGFHSSGIFFNNGITRFGNNPRGNRWAAGRTPRSNTSPTIVLEDGKVKLVTGAQGGSRIPNAVVYNILYALEYGLSAGEAMAGPRAFPFHGRPVLRTEAGFDATTLAALRERGFTIEPYRQQDPYFAGAHLILVRPDGALEGAADLRRAGSVAGY